MASMPALLLKSGLHSRVRRAMYLAFATLAVLSLLQAASAQRYEGVRLADAEIVGSAAAQRAAVHDIGRLAALAASAADRPVPLGDALRRARADAARIQSLLVERARDDAGVAAAQRHWQLARDRLWSQADGLLRELERGDAAASQRAGHALQREVDPALAAAGALSERLRTTAQVHSEQQTLLHESGVALTLGLLLLLALCVVEPTARAVSSQVLQLAQQARELARLALVAQRTDNIVFVSSRVNGIEWVNDAFTRRSGWSFEAARGKSASELLISPDCEGEALDRVRRAIANQAGVQAELLLRSRNGDDFWIDADIQPLHDSSGACSSFVTIGTDITERRLLQERLRDAARSDALTGLPNRAEVLDRLQRAIAHAQRHPGYAFAVLFMDVDRFKQINDTLGHAAGDELLRQVARRIEDTLRPGDAIGRVASQLPTAARIGGDEFVIVLEGVGTDAARTVAERLLAALGEPYSVGGQQVHSSASIGIVCAPAASPASKTAASAEDVLRNADTAMYEAKRAGRGRCVVFDTSMHDRVIAALALENDLRRALRDDELFVVYQPVVELGAMRLLGVEALVRWRHPQRGIVPPGLFIGIAEEAGMIDDIGRFVLRTACRQLSAWRTEMGAAAPREMAVNLSRAQLQGTTLVAEVRAAIDDNGLAPHDLQFEITESLAAQDERVQATLRELKALGVRLALDDFGTGYSSLACLHQMPVDTVKIDRSFVSHAETVEYHRVLIEATIRVAQALGMTTVAEGIETAGQAALMERLRCDRGQGWLFGRPMGAAELQAWIGRGIAETTAS